MFIVYPCELIYISLTSEKFFCSHLSIFYQFRTRNSLGIGNEVGVEDLKKKNHIAITRQGYYVYSLFVIHA